MKQLFVFFIALFGATLLHAQQETTEVDTLGEVVISANKVAEQKRDLPNQISVISQKQIERLNPLTTADALQNSGEVFVQKSQQGGGSPVIRGFEANKVLLVVDGVRMNNAIYRGGHLQNVITLDPYALERIEVLQGAGSVIYGTDAIGGVISVFTKRPRLSTTGKFTADAGGFVRYASANNGFTGNINLNLGGRKWANYFSITGNQFGDLRSGAKDLKDYPNFGDKNTYVERINGKDSVFANPNPDVQRASGYQQLDILEKLMFEPSSRWRHTINLQASLSSNVPRYDRLTEVANGLPRFAEWYYGPQNRVLASYQLQHQANLPWVDVIRVTPAYQNVEESRFDRRLNAQNRNERTEKLNIFSVNFDFFKNIGHHELRYGAEYVTNSLNSNGVKRDVDTDVTAPITSRYPDGTYNTQGVYVSHSWEIAGKRLILTDGARFSAVQMDVQFDPNFYLLEGLRDVRQQSESVNFNLGLVSNLPKGFRAAAMVSTGFRNPNIDDAAKIFENANNTINIPNANLKPEQVLHRELTLGWSPNQSVEFSATGYLSTLSDAIATRFTTYNGLSYLVLEGDTLQILHSTNVAKAEVKGFSVSTRLRFASHFTLGGSLAYAVGRDITEDVPLDHIPPMIGHVRLGYERSRWQVETDVLFNGWKRLEAYSPSGEDNQQYATAEGMPAWWVWNLRGSTTLLHPRLRIQAGVENILDLNYRVFASGINAPGRNFSIGLRWN